VQFLAAVLGAAGIVSAGARAARAIRLAPLAVLVAELRLRASASTRASSSAIRRASSSAFLRASSSALLACLDVRLAALVLVLAKLLFLLGAAPRFLGREARGSSSSACRCGRALPAAGGPLPRARRA
jgi:hypothetical protein